MAIGHVVTRGYGTGTLAGDVNLVVLRGYTVGEPAPEPEEDTRADIGPLLIGVGSMGVRGG